MRAARAARSRQDLGRKVFTLSPWSVNDYWEMTRVLDTDEYELT